MSLELDIGAEFHNTRSGRAARSLAERLTLNVGDTGARGHGPERRMIQNVEELGLKGEAQILANGKRLV
jgi:hypothetical protein